MAAVMLIGSQNYMLKLLYLHMGPDQPVVWHKLVHEDMYNCILSAWLCVHLPSGYSVIA